MNEQEPHRTAENVQINRRTSPTEKTQKKQTAKP